MLGHVRSHRVMSHHVMSRHVRKHGHIARTCLCYSDTDKSRPWSMHKPQHPVNTEPKLQDLINTERKNKLTEDEYISGLIC